MAQPITILHCSETLVLSGCCRVMEHLAKRVDATWFTSMLCAGSGDAPYLDYLHSQNITTLLLRQGKLPSIPSPFIAVLHRSGNSTPFWNRLIPKLREAGAKAIIERNIFGYPDGHEDKHLDRICANSLNTLWHHWRQSGKPDISHYLARHRVLYNIVSFSPDEAELSRLRTEWRKRLGISEDAFVVGIVTRPDPQKIDAIMLGLVPYLKKTIPNFTLVTRRYPQALAKPLKMMLGTNYHNLPLSPDAEALKATYALMDVCGNFPSIGESFGMSMAEAMRAYRPVIALDLPQKTKGNSQRELIEDGMNGYLAASPVEAAEAFQKLSLDKELQKKMGQAARQKMMSPPFAIETIIAQFEAEIRRNLGETVATPIMPDEATIKHYLETYPKHYRTSNASPNRKLLIQVTLARLIWKIVRRFL